MSMEFLQDMWGFFKTRKKFWLLPAVIVLVSVGALIIFGSGTAIAPFVYTIF
jgi:hypothetical protein